jgi:hypothetical protein
MARKYAASVAHFLFNLVGSEAEGPELRRRAADLLKARMWGVEADERHRDALCRGELVVVYLGAPVWELIGRAELASAAHDWTPSEAQAFPGESAGGVLLNQVEEWDPPVPIEAVLSQLDEAGDARADHDTGVLRITAHEYETALAVAAGRAR